MTTANDGHRSGVVPNYTPAVMRRRLHQLIMALFAVTFIGALAMVGGPFLNDREIDKNPGRALATVTDVGLMRTTIDYQDEENLYHSPQTGLLYPTGLGDGQQVWVTYSKDNPDLVKVEGRTWTLAILPALSVLFVAAILAIALWWLVDKGADQAERR